MNPLLQKIYRGPGKVDVVSLRLTSAWEDHQGWRVSHVGSYPDGTIFMTSEMECSTYSEASELFEKTCAPLEISPSAQFVFKKEHPEYSILVAMLKLAHDEFCSHGCNDYQLPNTEANRLFLEGLEKWNCPTDPCQLNISEDGTELDTADISLMAYLIFCLENRGGL